jgi:hypothetical protein
MPAETEEDLFPFVSEERWRWEGKGKEREAYRTIAAIIIVIVLQQLRNVVVHLLVILLRGLEKSRPCRDVV